MKRQFALLTAAAMMLSLTACGGGGGDAGGSSGGSNQGSSGVNITIFNSKSEIQSQMEEMAKQYTESSGVGVEVYYSSDTVAAHLSSRYAANNPYTMMMVDAKDVYSMGKEYAIDLSDQQWVNDTEYAISIDNAVYGFPVSIEARGLIYNADAIKNITGKDFVPEDYATLDKFKGLIDELKAGGMEAPTGVMKEDWSLGAHFLCEIYEQHEDPEAFISALQGGTAKLADDEKFNSMMDTFDVLKANNYAAASAIAAEREVTEQKLAEGEIAFMFGGNWDWAVLKEYDYTENMGMMPVPQDTSDGTNAKLVGGGSKFFYIDNSENTTDEQRQAAKDFLNWLVYEADGNKFLTETCALVPPFSNIEAAGLDPLGLSVKKYVDAGSLIPNYDYLPDDHYSVLGASMQKYLADQTDRAGLASEIEAYWKTAKVIEH